METPQPGNILEDPTTFTPRTGDLGYLICISIITDLDAACNRLVVFLLGQTALCVENRFVSILIRDGIAGCGDRQGQLQIVFVLPDFTVWVK